VFAVRISARRIESNYHTQYQILSISFLIRGLTSDFASNDLFISNTDEIEVRVDGRELDHELLYRTEQIIRQLGRISVDAHDDSRRSKCRSWRDRDQMFPDRRMKMILDVQSLIVVQSWEALIYGRPA